MVKLYRNNELVRYFVKSLPALAFVPVEADPDAFDELQESEDFLEDLTDFFAYFETTYIGKRLRNGRRRPRYPPAYWNVRDRIFQGLPRTNNQIEGFHRGLRASLDSERPSIWKALKFIINEERLQAAVAEGIEGRVERKDVKERNQRLITVANDFSNRNVLDFLRGVTCNYNLNV